MPFLSNPHLLFWRKTSLPLNVGSVGPRLVVLPSLKCGWSVVLVEKECSKKEMKASRKKKKKKSWQC